MSPVSRIAFAIALMAAVVSAAPRQTTQLKGTGVVSGRVIDQVSGRPVRGAVVILSLMMEESILVPMQPVSGIAPSPGFANYGKGVETGADGTFEFSGVPRGGFEIRASRIGTLTYESTPTVPPEGRRWFELREGERRTDVELRVAGPATFSGRVVNQSGSPLANIPVVVSPIGISPDSSRDGAKADLTDDRGRFLIVVPPGDYIVATRQFPEVASGSGPSSVYGRQFYPGVESIGDAVRVRAVRGREQSGIDFVLKTVRTFRISGTVSGAPPAQRLAVTLLNPRDSRADTIADSGQVGVNAFAFSGVPPGQYLVRAIAGPNMPFGSHGVPALREMPPEPTLWARELVTVTDRDVSLQIDLAPGPRISGRVEFDGNRTPPAPDDMPALIIDRADAADADFRGVYLSGGRFSTIQLEPARYFILAWPPREWRLKSVMAGGRDLRDYPLDVGTTDVNDVVITFTDRRTAIAGRVIREGEFEWIRGWVTIFPFDRALWSEYGTTSRRIAFVEPGHAGTFEAELPPGSYLIAATPDSIRGRIGADALTALAAIAVPVTVGEGQVARQDVRIRSWRR